MSEKKILALVIEDDYDASIIFSEALKANGAETEIIRSGTLALERLSQIEVAPDIVLLDLHLPGVDGTKILTSIRANKKLKSVPVVVITADPGMAETLTDDTELVLLKPTTFSQVRALTSRILLMHGSSLKSS